MLKKLLLQGRPLSMDTPQAEQYPQVLRQFLVLMLQRGMRAKTIVEYERIPFTYPAGNVRITFDRNIRASRETEAFGIQGISYDFLEGQDYILEIKYDEFLPQFIPQLMETGCLRQVSYSKYRICRERYGGF